MAHINWDRVHEILKSKEDFINKQHEHKCSEKASYELKKVKEIIEPIISNPTNFEPRYGDSRLECTIQYEKYEIDPNVVCEVVKNLGFKCNVQTDFMNDISFDPFISITLDH